MDTLFTCCLVLVGLVNLAPVLGMFSASKMEQTYGIELGSKDLAIMMRHRALLFGILGSFIICAVFVPVFQVPAMLMAGISMIGFVVLALHAGGYNQSIFKVLVVDLLGTGLLLVAVVVKVYSAEG